MGAEVNVSLAICVAVGTLVFVEGGRGVRVGSGVQVDDGMGVIVGGRT